MTSIIITDLTRFRNDAIVCLSGVDPKDGKTYRPLPYLKREFCKQANILPGTKLEIQNGQLSSLKKPHTEDFFWSGAVPNNAGSVKSSEFESVLHMTAFKTICEGFDGKVPQDEKYIPYDDPPSRSLISIRIPPRKVEIVTDPYKAGNLKIHLEDNDGRRYSFLSLTDLCFFEYAKNNYGALGDIKKLNEYIHQKKYVFLRIGLSRVYAPNQPNDPRHGFWIQVNGVYTFPDFLSEIRAYTP